MLEPFNESFINSYKSVASFYLLFNPIGTDLICTSSSATNNNLQ